MSDTEASVKKARRRIRWSLRVLFVFIGLIAIGMAWVSYQMRMGHVHEDAAKKLRELGVSIDWKLVETTQLSPTVIASKRNCRLGWND